MGEKKTEKHMGWRGSQKNYCWPGIYHITISVMERKQQPLGRITGDVGKPDGDPLAPRVLLSDIGKMVEHELLQSICAHYPMVEVQDYVVMPDHLHFIVNVHRTIISSNGRETHLGQVIAGFKKGCNRRYWELTGQGEPVKASTVSLPAVYPQPSSASSKLPSTASTGRPPLFSYGYVDVMPLKEGQLERQREYIRNNPRYRLMRQNNPRWLLPQRTNLCADNKLLILTPWKYAYRRVDDTISVAECKTMNCIVQAICSTKDSWWKE